MTSIKNLLHKNKYELCNNIALSENITAVNLPLIPLEVIIFSNLIIKKNEMLNLANS
jgi:hypothetical protein